VNVAHLLTVAVPGCTLLKGGCPPSHTGWWVLLIPVIFVMALVGFFVSSVRLRRRTRAARPSMGAASEGLRDDGAEV
jgi:hypothetical protein